MSKKPNLTIEEIQVTIARAINDFAKYPANDLVDFCEYLMTSADIVRALVLADEIKQFKIKKNERI